VFFGGFPLALWLLGLREELQLLRRWVSRRGGSQ
jgi:hypothetical protein